MAALVKGSSCLCGPSDLTVRVSVNQLLIDSSHKVGRLEEKPLREKGGGPAEPLIWKKNPEGSASCSCIWELLVRLKAWRCVLSSAFLVLAGAGGHGRGGALQGVRGRGGDRRLGAEDRCGRYGCSCIEAFPHLIPPYLVALLRMGSGPCPTPDLLTMLGCARVVPGGDALWKSVQYSFQPRLVKVGGSAGGG
jgi:hypothetical protein